ncbi:hypothetical protein [Actinomadura sp. HBU206391]|uniref:hypothetical protein n=1 Tax=Actinomadura sp. HBU206391 TaxID=2731692 RepID=UPI0016503FD2|nr:hypothetical protein [Actinomadura sp. HBU206391]MBC6457218.1 hypothetical protein [Actinomadura sp. HBU206391]
MNRVSTLLLTVPMLALTACGGSSGDGIASAGGGKASASASARASVDPDQAQLRYARCMRENGVAMPDDPRDLPKGGLAIPDKAMKACEEFQKALGGTRIDMNDPETRDRFTKLAQCMRKHGFDFPDPPNMPPPDFDGGNKPRFDRSLKDCGKFLPSRG